MCRDGCFPASEAHLKALKRVGKQMAAGTPSSTEHRRTSHVGSLGGKPETARRPRGTITRRSRSWRRPVRRPLKPSALSASIIL